MDCVHAYLKQNIPYILCRLEKEPSRENRADIAHAACAHQAHCPKENCHKLTPAWVNCGKLGEKATQKPQKAAEERNATKATIATPKKKVAHKASGGAEKK